MFYVFNKQKIYSYLIASSTVIVLLAVSILFTAKNTKKEQRMVNSIEKKIETVQKSNV